MSGSEGASVATDALRKYASFLAGDSGMEQVWRNVRSPSRPPMAADSDGDSCAGRIRALIAKLEQEKLPVEAWGAPGAHLGPVGPSRSEYVLHSGPAPDHYAAFRQAYEAAHEAMVTRLRNLAELYEETATAYRVTAQGYDALNDTGD